MNLRETFANNVRELRAERKLSQEDLAYICRCHRTYIGHIEQGRANASIDYITRISQALNVAPYELFVSHNRRVQVHAEHKAKDLTSKANHVEYAYMVNVGESSLMYHLYFDNSRQALDITNFLIRRFG